MRLPTRTEKGFTLAELLIVLAILAVLAAMVVPGVMGMLGRGTAEALSTDTRTIQGAVTTFYWDAHSGPSDGRWGEGATGHYFPTVDGRPGRLTESSFPLAAGDTSPASALDGIIWMGLLANSPKSGGEVGPGKAGPQSNEAGPYLNEVPKSASEYNSNSLSSGPYTWIVLRNETVAAVEMKGGKWVLAAEPIALGGPPVSVVAEAPASPVVSPSASTGHGYWIRIDTINGLLPEEWGTPFSSPIHLTGSAGATDYSGRISQHQVQVEWDQNVIDPDSTVDFAPSSAKGFSGTWSSSPDHSYLVAKEYTIVVTLYHQQYPGAEKSLDAVAVVTINVVNDGPVAGNDSYSTNEDVVLNVGAAAGVLANDTDADNDPLTAVKVTNPGHGAVTLNADGSFVYTPSANFVGSDSFTYKANDGKVDSNVATVTITVSGVNDAPVAGNDSYSTNEDVVLNVGAATGVLANDTDADNDPLTAVKVSEPGHGTVALNSDGSFVYTPAANFVGSDSFTYKASDGQADSNVATVTITVSGVNDAPVAVNDSYSTNEDVVLNVGAAGVLANDTDADNDPLTAVKESGPWHGTVTLNANGSFSYTPGANFVGSDSFTYKANDGKVDSNVATVTITVSGVNDGPVAVNDSYSTNEDVVLNVGAVTGVLANDTDADNDPLTAVKVSEPGHGTLTLNADGSFVYTPVANYNGSDSFTYKASDGKAESTVATVTITVNGVNDGPVAVNDSYSTNEDVVLNVGAAAGVLANDTDADNDPLTAVKVSEPGHGTLTLNADGSFVYTPVANYNGSDSFTYKASDGQAESNVATVTIRVGSRPPGGGGGGGGESVGQGWAVRYFTVDFLGRISREVVTEEGRLAQSLVAPSPDNIHSLEIDKDTRVVDSQGEVVLLLEIRQTAAPPLPGNTVVVGSAYDFGPSNITFDRPISLSLGYEVDKLPKNVGSVGLAYHTTGTGWVDLKPEPGSVAEVGKVTSSVDHFTVFAVLGKVTTAPAPPVAAPAAFKLSNLLVTPSQSKFWNPVTFASRIGQAAAITVIVTNAGGQEGKYTANLMVNGAARTTQEVSLKPGQGQQIVFRLNGFSPGRYTVEVGDLRAEFSSLTLVNWWLSGPCLAAIAAALVLLARYYWIRRRRKLVAQTLKMLSSRP